MADTSDTTSGRRPLPWPALPPWLVDVAGAALRERSTWPHALLVHGARGIGKHALALHLAQGLLCESPQASGRACGQCPSCRYAIAGEHPDLMRVELIDVDDHDEWKQVDTIVVDRIRALTQFALLTSHRQRAKVAVIAPAERMNVAAANALLKTLEEPPAGTFLILVADRIGALPATIVSRCRRMNVAPPPAEDARAWLAAQGVDAPELALAQAGGAPLLALALADPDWQSERRVWLAALAEPRRLPIVALAARVDAGPKEVRRERLARAIDWLLGWSADLARVAAGGEARSNPDCAAALGALAGRMAPLPAFRYHQALTRERALLAHPLQPRLVAEAALIDYRGLFI